MGNTAEAYAKANMEMIDTCSVHLAEAATFWCDECSVPICPRCKTDGKNVHFNHRAEILQDKRTSAQNRVQKERLKLKTYLHSEERNLQDLKNVQEHFNELVKQAQESLKAEEQSLMERLRKIRANVQKQNRSTSEKYLMVINSKVQALTADIHTKEAYIQLASKDFKDETMIQWLNLSKKIKSHQPAAKSLKKAPSLAESLKVDLRSMVGTPVLPLCAGTLAAHSAATAPQTIDHAVENSSDEEGSLQLSVGSSSRYGSTDDLSARPTVYSPEKYNLIKGHQLSTLSASWAHRYKKFESDGGPYPGPVDFAPDGFDSQSYFITSFFDARKLKDQFGCLQKEVPIPRVTKDKFQPTDVFVVTVINLHLPPAKQVTTNIYTGNYCFPKKIEVTCRNILVSHRALSSARRNVQNIFSRYGLKHFERFYFVVKQEKGSPQFTAQGGSQLSGGLLPTPAQDGLLPLPVWNSSQPQAGRVGAQRAGRPEGSQSKQWNPQHN